MLALNPYKVWRVVNDDSSTQELINDHGLTQKLFNNCINTLGSRCLIGQHSLRDSWDDRIFYQNYFLPHANKGYPVYIQTEVFMSSQWGVAYTYTDFLQTLSIINEPRRVVFIEIPNKWDCENPLDYFKSDVGYTKCKEQHRALTDECNNARTGLQNTAETIFNQQQPQ